MGDTGDKQRMAGSGRGSMIKKMMQMREQEQGEMVQSHSALQSIPPRQTIQGLPQVPPPMPESFRNVPSMPTSAGRGRASLINLLKSLNAEDPVVQPQTSSVLSPVSSTPAALPKTQGRGAMLNLIKNVRQPTAEPDTSTVVSKMDKVSIRDISTTEDTYKPPASDKRVGTSGVQVDLCCNYINVNINPDKGMFNYEVKFNPDIDSRPLRHKLLNQHVERLGRTKIFDGVNVYLPTKPFETDTTFQSTHPMDGSTVTLTFVYKRQQCLARQMMFFNILLGRCMRALSLVRIGQHNFNPKGTTSIPQHRLEVWPGYVTAINEYDGGLKLLIDAKHRVMRTETARDLMINLRKRSDHRDCNIKDDTIKELVGTSVFTRYNNKTYRVDDIDWEKNPQFKFDRNGEEITLIDYYKSHWNIEIRDPNQPLLVHYSRVKLSTGTTEEKLILLVPELCYVAGLTDNIRSDYRVMKDLDAVTKVSPNNRRDVIRKFVREVQSNDVAREILAEWGLQLEPDIANLPGRVLNPETIYFGNNKTFTPAPQRPAEWSTAACRNGVLRTPNLNNWCIFYCQKDKRCAEEFIEMLKNVAKAMQIKINNPRQISLADNRIDTIIRELRNNIQRDLNLVVTIFPTNRTDKYTAVKRLCCTEMPIPSQVIIAKTISRADKLKSVTEKIALQINCKLGGALWMLQIPMENCMICGIDVYHGGVGQNKRSVAGFVASLDKILTTWHSKICLQGKHQELIDLLQLCLISAIKEYRKHNGNYPDRIIIYRDGVGDGQLETIAKYEVKQLVAAFKYIEPNYQPKMSLIIVQKRINTRIFLKSNSGLGNPPAGTIVDSKITKSELFDFFLVSQHVRQGTVSPTRYIVIYDTACMKPDHMQRLTYKLCHLYYNFPGTIKVPAPCQYAHKLVYLVGQTFEKEPHYSLENSLYYL